MKSTLTCNLSYNGSEEHRTQIRSAVTTLWKFKNRSVALEMAKFKLNDTPKSMVLDKVGGEFASDFILTVLNKICELDNNSLETLSAKAKNLLDLILGYFFQMDNSNIITEFDVLEVSAGITDQDIIQIAKEKMNTVAGEVYGLSSLSLLGDLEQSFKREMQLMLLYDPYSATVLLLSRAEANVKILDYKLRKFNNILNFLRGIYSDENSQEYVKLNNIKGLYDTLGYINKYSYEYVITLFMKYLLLHPELQERLSKEYMEKLVMTYEKVQTEKFNKLLNELKKVYPSWYNDNITASTLKVDIPMYNVNRPSKYYYKVKSKIQATLKANANDPNAKKWALMILEIESPNNGILEVVQDFLKLTHFDDLISSAFSDTLSYSRRSYTPNAMSNTLLDLKYEIKQSKKHLNSGYENADKENSETHTGATVKTILSSLAIYKYDAPSVATPAYMDMNHLNQAWQALVNDIIQDNFKTNRPEKEARLRELICNRDRPIEAISEVLSIIFKDLNLKKLRGTRLTTDLTLNILFSFYQLVLNEDNPDSIKSLEIAKFNDEELYVGQHLPVTSALVGILYRNVNNNFIDCFSDHSFKIKARFSWDSDLFDLIEGCNFPSKLRQANLIDLEPILINKYNFTSLGDTASVTIGDSTLVFTHGVKYRRLKFLDTSRVSVTSGDLLAKAGKAKLESFIIKKFGGGQLDENETALNLLLEFVDYYTGIGFLNNESMMLALKLYQENYASWHQGEKIPFANYLTYFVNLAVGVASVEYDAYNANKEGKSLKEYYNSNKGLYLNVYAGYKKGSYRTKIKLEGSRVFLIPVSNFDPVLKELAKYKVVAEGRSVKSTSRNKSNDSVANYTISRRGSELPSIIQNMIKEGDNSAGKSLLFIRNPNLLNTDPVVDSEVTTLNGEIKTVSSMTTTELIQHALIDKFYFSFIYRDLICFLPTVYSDKSQFLNYFGNVLNDKNGVSLMHFSSENFEENCINLYKETFFLAHANMFKDSVNKINKLANFAVSGKLDVGSDDKNLALSFLRQHSYEGDDKGEGLFQIITRYNEAVAEHNRIEATKLTDKHFVKEIDLELDKDYRVINDNQLGKYCELNEISEFYAALSVSSDTGNKLRHDYFEALKKLFALDIKNSLMNLRLFDNKSKMLEWIKFDPNEGTEPHYSSYILNIISSSKLLNYKLRENFVKNWVNLETGELIIQDETGRLNPFFEKFFYLEGLYSNNLRLMLSGSEVNHPNGSLKFNDTLYHQFKNIENNSEFIAKLIDEGIVISEQIPSDELIDAARAVLASTLNVRDLRLSLDPILRGIYINALSGIINTSLGTQFKRNVIIPATLLHLIPGKIDGVSDEVLVAVIEDEKAPVNNLRESDSIDASDGSARMSPILVMLENTSLDDLRVGTNRKPIWGQIGNDLTLFEAKFAAFGMTNLEILNSMQSSTSLYRLFKKMHNIRWNGEIDITHSIKYKKGANATTSDLITWFQKVILQDLHLYYRNADNEIIEITGIGIERRGTLKTYYTLEKKAGILNLASEKVYHHFDDLGKHYTSLNSAATEANGRPLHTIDSLFELYLALGGAYNCNSDGRSSDINLLALTNFVVNVGYKVSDEIRYVNDVVQPLRNKFIAYAFNHTAVKCGARNINPRKAWNNDDKLTTFKVKTSGLGIQLNADHNADEAELTEFSLVIAACSAYGKNFSSVDEIYKGLAQSALEESGQELLSINDFLAASDEKAKYKLYKIIAKLILLSSSNSEYDLGTQVKYEIDRAFNECKNKTGNELKVPFSDPSFYNQFITSITSVINKKSIKRKHPGTGYVMSPGYNVVLHYQVWDGEQYVPYMYEDILRKAQNDYRGKLITLVQRLLPLGQSTITVNRKNVKNELITVNVRIKDASLRDLRNFLKSRRNFERFIIDPSTILDPEEAKLLQLRNSEYQAAIDYLQISTEDTTDFNNAIISKWLSKKQQEEPLRLKGWFMPTDNVRISTANGDVVYNMDAMEDFYRFKSGLPVKEATEKLYNVTIVEEKDGKIRIKLNELKHPENPKLDLEFVLERNPEDTNLSYFIHFRTGEVGPDKRRVLSADGLKSEQKTRLFLAALERLPVGATLSLSPTTVEQLTSGKGGLSYLSIAGFNSLNPNLADLYKAIAETNKIKEEDKPIIPDLEAIDRRLNRQPERIGGATIELVGDYQPVWYFDNNNQLKQTLVGKYKKVAQHDNYKYKLDVINPVNLKPSLIRWAYNYTTKDNLVITRYMTIYDHPIIKASWNKDKAKRPTRALIQKVLDDLDKGYFYLGGQRYEVLEGSLENTEAELVMGNMYASLFGIEGESLAEILELGEDYFRKKAGQSFIPTLPTGFYDLAFTKDSGYHTLIALGTIDESNGIVENPYSIKDEVVNDDGEIKCDNIKIGKYIDAPSNWKILEVDGNYIVTLGDTVIPKSEYMIENPGEAGMKVKKRVNFVRRYTMTRVLYDTYKNPKYTKYTLYKIADVNEIKEALNRKTKDGSREYTEEEMRKAAMAQISSILKHLYDDDYYNDVVINTSVGRQEEVEGDPTKTTWVNRVSNVRSRLYLFECLGDAFASSMKREKGKFVQKDPKELSKFELHILNVKKLLVTKTTDANTPFDFISAYKEELKSYHTLLLGFSKKWASFLTSLHFIASRIPAQSLLSFMPMKCVGWLSGSSNTAYVSYILTYLLGSDYDIDKAYIMGQSFTDGGLYIGWSNLFDYSNDTLIAASKTLPVPKGYKLQQSDSKEYSIDKRLGDLLNEVRKLQEIKENLDKNPEDKSLKRKRILARANIIKAYAKLINKIDSQKGLYYTTIDIPFVQLILKTIQEHENFEIPYRTRSAAYKNVASANIFNNVHNIRNRDLAYSPITMKDLRKSADHSPKGNRVRFMSMINPITKYHMLYENIMGRRDIGIMANGEKVWFNLTYYYHNLLRYGDESDIFFLKMNKTYDRIKGRTIGEPLPSTVKHIPDLWCADGYTLDKDGKININSLNGRVASRLKELFYQEMEPEEVDDVYVDQLISLLLSAATDNAKELILAKINAGTEFAKYYLHLIIMGYSLDDVVSFMTSPAVELIDKYSSSDDYSGRVNSISTAMDLLKGEISPNVYMPLTKAVTNNTRIFISDPEALQEYEESMLIQALDLADRLMDADENNFSVSVNTSYSDIIKSIGTIYNAAESKSLKDFISKYVKAKLSEPTEGEPAYYKTLRNFDLSTVKLLGNFKANSFLRFIDSIINDVKETISSYNKATKNNYTLLDFTDDLNLFDTLTEDANETTTLASVWLKFNLGIPQTDVEIIKRIKKMNDTVATRENIFGIHKVSLSIKRYKITLLDDISLEDKDSIEKDKKEAKQNMIAAYINIISDTPTTNKKVIGFLKVLTSIKEKNPLLEYKDIVSILLDAIDADLYGNFNVYEFLKDSKITLEKRNEDLTYNNYKYEDKISNTVIGYRELAARYYNLIKGSWNILDIIRRIPHYKLNMDLFNYTLLARLIFSMKTKITDTLLSMANLLYMSLSDSDYKTISRYADSIINTSFFFLLKDPIPLGSFTESDLALPNTYDECYRLGESDILNLNSLHGIDSLKHFVENEFLLYLKLHYPDNFLVKALILRSNRGVTNLRTTLNLDEISASLTNLQTYAKYLLAINELAKIKVRDINGDETKYSLADILALYNLAVYGTRAGGKNLTAVFRGSVNRTIIHDYYKFLGNDADYANNASYIYPTKQDLLIALAPLVFSSVNLDNLHKEPYVKVASTMGRYDLYERYYDREAKRWKYRKLEWSSYFRFPYDMTYEEKELAISEYLNNTINVFPQLHSKLVRNNIISLNTIDTNFEKFLAQIRSDIHSNLIRIIQRCG